MPKKGPDVITVLSRKLRVKILRKESDKFIARYLEETAGKWADCGRANLPTVPYCYRLPVTRTGYRYRARYGSRVSLLVVESTVQQLRIEMVGVLVVMEASSLRYYSRFYKLLQ
jgi:hypothetical protein